MLPQYIVGRQGIYLYEVCIGYGQGNRSNRGKVRATDWMNTWRWREIKGLGGGRRKVYNLYTGNFIVTGSMNHGVVLVTGGNGLQRQTTPLEYG